MKGFNKDSSEGNPAIESEPAISTEATAGSVELNVHSNATGAIPDSGIVIRLDVDKISAMSRVTQGVRLINLKENSLVSSVALVDKEEAVETNNENKIEDIEESV